MKFLISFAVSSTLVSVILSQLVVKRRIEHFSDLLIESININNSLSSNEVNKRLSAVFTKQELLEQYNKITSILMKRISNQTELEISAIKIHDVQTSLFSKTFSSKWSVDFNLIHKSHVFQRTIVFQIQYQVSDGNDFKISSSSFQPWDDFALSPLEISQSNI